MKALLYNAEMLAAYVAGRKTVTRRLMKPQPRTDADRVSFYDGKARFYHGNAHLMDFDQKPRYHKGEIVYVPEPYRIMECDGNLNDFAVEYKDGAVVFWRDNAGEQDYPISMKWRSPRFMPAKYARLFDRIVDVKPERLNLHSLSPQELALEGGEAAYDYLWKHDGLWVWRYQTEPLNPSEVKKALNE